MIGMAIQGLDANDAIEQIVQAEQAGIPAAWATMGGAGGADMMVTFAAAATQTERIQFGTSIVQTWPRHPVAISQQALALEQLAPGRFRLGIGPAHQAAMERTYGVDWRRPLTNLREYITTIRALLHEGSVDFEGEHVTVRSSLREPVGTPVMASALRVASFELCGELADGAISWMCPRNYLVERALPALKAGAERAGRAAPPLIAHVPIVVGDDREAAGELVRSQLGRYAQAPFYRAMFADAGFPDAGDGYSDELLDGLVVHGSEEEVAAGLADWLEAGMGEVLAMPVLDPDDRAGSLDRSIAAIARAAREVA